MSQENVDIVLSMYAPWERGDFSSAEWAHPDIEWVIADGPAPGSWKGVAAMVEGWREFLSAWDELASRVGGGRRARARRRACACPLSLRGTRQGKRG